MDESRSQIPYKKPDNLAGVGRRWGGQMIDTVVTYLVFFIVGKVAALLHLPPTVTAVSALGAAAAYYLLSDALPNGQSVGKKLLGMSVIDECSYLNCSVYQSFVRNITTPFLSILDWIFIFFGSRKRLGDMLASTIVIRAR